ncbi:MAG TPA: methyl-accepting chemotaxis protein [Myxococcota bacterium]|nr:methyl-accepting chemotaxis protein [Myxococcota bacterium]HRY92159.1 methyl-accepting chemotaxis protein [Myxococcota bacterium]HSA20649.1 methyl-accepting chemotaxis protein [Myxococcota bacterium]
MTLRTRLLLGYGYLVALLMVSAVSSAVAFQGLGQGIEKMLDQNYASVDAAQIMLEALERQDTATLQLLLDPAGSRDGLAAADEAFGKGLSRARKNITEPGEAEVVARLEAAHVAYLPSRSALLAAPGAQALASYRASTAPRLREVQAQARALRELNEAAMRRADQDTRGRAVRGSAWLGLVVLLAVGSMAWLTRKLQRDFLARLGHMGGFAQAIAGGERRRRLPVGEPDELGLVARLLNETLDGRDRLQGELEGRLNLHRDLVLGLVRALGAGAVLCGEDGELLAAGSPAPAAEWLAAVQLWLQGPGRVQLRAAETGEGPREVVAALPAGPGQGARAELLCTAAGRAVGWLVRPPA